jgi:hypothetical protein
MGPRYRKNIAPPRFPHGVEAGGVPPQVDESTTEIVKTAESKIAKSAIARYGGYSR